MDHGLFIYLFCLSLFSDFQQWVDTAFVTRIIRKRVTLNEKKKRAVIVSEIQSQIEVTVSEK